MMKTSSKYYIGNTNYFEVIELTNSITGNLENNANITMTVKYLTGAFVVGAETPLAFIASGTGGHYTLSFEFPSLVGGDRCIATIIAIDSSGFKKEWDVKIIAVEDVNISSPCPC